MITEWQPIMPDDTLKLKSRTIYEFLRGNHSTFLAVGQGVDKEANMNLLIKDEDVVAYREFDTQPKQAAIAAPSRR